MHLVSFDNYELKISPEALLVKPIRDLYRKDTMRNKDFFYRQMSYIYFMIDPRSTYMYITNEEERSKTIIEQESLANANNVFNISKELEKAMEWYKKHTITTSSLMLQSTLIAADKIRKFLTEVELTEVDDNGKSKYDVSKITNAMKNVMEIIPKLKELEKKVVQDTEDKTRTGIRQKAMFEDFNPVFNEDE